MATYIVDKRVGSDNYTTTQAQNTATPWKTLKKVNSSVPTGEHTIEIIEGSGDYVITDLGNTGENSFYPQQGAGSDITYNFNGNALRADINFNNGSYRWTRSTSPGKTGWFRLSNLDGSRPKVPQYDGGLVNLPTVVTCTVAGFWSSNSDNLNNPPYFTPGQSSTLYGGRLYNNWYWGDLDSLGYSTLYILLDGGVDPTNTGAEIWASTTSVALFRGGYGGSIHRFHDAFFSGATIIFSATHAIEIVNTLCSNADQSAFFLTSSTAGQQYTAKKSIFLNCGHAALYFNARQNFDMYSCHTENTHTVAKMISDTAYTLNYFNNTTKNLFAGVIQKDVATPTLNEDYNQHHIDPNTTHGGQAIAFTAGVRLWTTTGGHDLPANTATSAFPGIDPLLTSSRHLQPTSPCIGAGTTITGITTDIEGNQLYPPYNIGPYGIAAGELVSAPVANDGPPRNNITQLTGTSITIAPAGTYKLADTKAARDATGFVYGVDHWAFTSTGIPKEILGSVLIANGRGDQFYCGDKGLAGYAAPQNAAANAKIIRVLRVHTYIDSLYYIDHQEMDWSETNE